MSVDSASRTAPGSEARQLPGPGRWFVSRDLGGFRPDIQGLRALAVGIVVLYHLWPNRLTGGFVGVDVFFVISGFLITSHLLARPPRAFGDLTRFWGRRISRLLPASLLVLAVTLIASRIVAPATQWVDTAKQVTASALYVQNWALAAQSVDYLGADEAATPVQHFWSLSVEEQFYLVWPVLILVLAAVATRFSRSLRSVLWIGLVTVTLTSFAFSVWATANEPASAYFITPTRIWELALGGILALLPGLGRGVLSSVVAWGGLVMIMVTALTYTGATPFPGYTAALPVVGTALVIWAAADRRHSPTAPMAFRPVQWLGGVSYSVYLWHWPLIVLLPHVSGGDLGRLDKAVILVTTAVLAHLSKVFVEDRFRSRLHRAPSRRSFQLAAVLMALVVALGSLQWFEVNRQAEAAEARLTEATSGTDQCVGAGAIVHGEQECPIDPGGELIPIPTVAKEDKSDAYSDGCIVYAPYTDRSRCSYGDGPTKVALVGNSHAAMYLPALQALAKEKDWTVDTYLVSSCNFTAERMEFNTEEKVENCHAYGQDVLAQTSGDAYDLVITSARQSDPVEGETLESTEERAVAGYEEYLTQWSEGGTNLLVLRDTPAAGNTIDSTPECLAENSDDHAACNGTPESWYWMDPLDQAAANLDLPNISREDMTQFICRDDTCYAAVGGVITFFDSYHLTATYVQTMTPYLEPMFEEALSR